MTPDRPNLLQTHRSFAQRILERSQLLLGLESSSADLVPQLEPQGWLRQVLEFEQPSGPFLESLGSAEVSAPVHLFVPGRPLEPEEFEAELEEGTEFLELDPLDSGLSVARPSVFDALANAWAGPQFAREEIPAVPFETPSSPSQSEFPTRALNPRALTLDRRSETTKPEPSVSPRAELPSSDLERPSSAPSSAEVAPRAPYQIPPTPGATSALPTQVPELPVVERSSDLIPELSNTLETSVVDEPVKERSETPRAPTLAQVWGEQMRTLLEAAREDGATVPPSAPELNPPQTPPGPPSRREGSRAQPRLPKAGRAGPAREPQLTREAKQSGKPNTEAVMQPEKLPRADEKPRMDLPGASLERPALPEIARTPDAQKFTNDSPEVESSVESATSQLEGFEPALEGSELASGMEQTGPELVQDRSSELQPTGTEQTAQSVFPPLEMPNVSLPAGSVMVEDYRPSRRNAPSPRPKVRSSGAGETDALFQGQDIKPQSWGEWMKEILLEGRGAAAQASGPTGQQAVPPLSAPRAVPQGAVPQGLSPTPLRTPTPVPAPPVPAQPSFAQQARAQGTPTPLSPQTRRFLEPIVGFDPVDVAVFQTPQADALTQQVGADALTVGETVLLPSNTQQNDPRTLGLLAHEMTHVAQNRARGRVFVPPVVRPAPLEGSEEVHSSGSVVPAPQNRAFEARGKLDSGDFSLPQPSEPPFSPFEPEPALRSTSLLPALENNLFEEASALQAESDALSRATLEQSRAFSRPPLSQSVLRNLLEPTQQETSTQPDRATQPDVPRQIPVVSASSPSFRIRTPEEQATWGNLPTPWELQASYSAVRTSVPSSVPANRVSPAFEPSSVPLSEPMQAAATSRTLPTPSSAAEQSPDGPLPSRAAQQQAPQARVPEPDLDRLAQQVYGLLKRRLSAETRRP